MCVHECVCVHVCVCTCVCVHVCVYVCMCDFQKQHNCWCTHAAPPVLVVLVLAVKQRCYHCLHPGQVGTQVSCVHEVIMAEGLLKLLRHLLEVCEVAYLLVYV